MKLKLHRRFKGEDYTIGTLFINGVRFCDTLEDKVRDLPREEKVYGKTAIPSGTYRVALTYSNKFKRLLPLLLDVPYFRGVRIHRGNAAVDTEGCPLIGENKVKGKVINSTKYEVELVGMMKDAIQKNEDIEIEIC